MSSVAHSEQRQNAPFTQTLTDRYRIIAAVAENAIGSMTWTAPLALQWWNGTNKCEGLLRVVTVGAGELNG